MANKIREAATLLIASKISRNSSCLESVKQDYNLILLKRSGKSRFMPNAVVFPGGAFDKSDGNQTWSKVFQNAGYQQNYFNDQFSYSTPDNRTSCYSNASSPSSLLPEVAYRLCALRETFEETGLLIASEAEKPLIIQDEEHTVAGKALKEWRTDVQREPMKFLDLFASFSPVVPWVAGLVEWWGWLTPLFMSARFNTIFYTVCLDEEIDPKNLSCCKESQNLQVLPPSSIIEDWHSGNCWLGPPQVYELGRLANYQTLEQLRCSIENRTDGGKRVAPIEVWTPQLYNTKEGSVTLLPGDHLYSENFPFSDHRGSKDGPLKIGDKNPYLDLAFDELQSWRPEVPQGHSGPLGSMLEGLSRAYHTREGGKNLLNMNRGEIRGSHDTRTVVNGVVCPYGQVNPVGIYS